MQSMQTGPVISKYMRAESSWQHPFATVGHTHKSCAHHESSCSDFAKEMNDGQCISPAMSASPSTAGLFAEDIDTWSALLLAHSDWWRADTFDPKATISLNKGPFFDVCGLSEPLEYKCAGTQGSQWDLWLPPMRMKMMETPEQDFIGSNYNTRQLFNEEARVQKLGGWHKATPIARMLVSVSPSRGSTCEDYVTEVSSHKQHSTALRNDQDCTCAETALLAGKKRPAAICTEKPSSGNVINSSCKDVACMTRAHSTVDAIGAASMIVTTKRAKV